MILNSQTSRVYRSYESYVGENVGSKVNVGISTVSVSRHKTTSLHVSSFIAYKNENAVKISIVGLTASIVDDTKLTNQQSLSLLRTLGKNIGGKVNVGISTVSVSGHKLTSFHVSSFIAYRNETAVMISIVGLIASNAHDTKPTNEQNISLLRTLGENVGSKINVGISTVSLSRHKLTSLHVSSSIAYQNENAVVISIVGLIASNVSDTKLTNQQSYRSYESSVEMLEVR